MKVTKTWHDEFTHEIDLADELDKLAAKTGLFDASKTGWMLPILRDGVVENELKEVLASQIKTYPPLLTAAEKRALGINTRVKIGEDFAACLTAAGKVDPTNVAQRIAGTMLRGMNDGLRGEMNGGRDGWNLFTNFLARKQNCAPDEVRMIEGSPMEAIELLWTWLEPMQALRRDPKAAAMLDRLPYTRAGEYEFDSMLERIAKSDGGNFRNDTNAGAVVWTERVQQAIMSLMVNAQQGLPTVLPPPDMAKGDRQAAIGLLWLYRMNLPFPVGSGAARSAAETPAASGDLDSTTTLWIMGVTLAILVFVSLLLLIAR